MQFIRAPALSAGDRVGLVAPSRPVADGRLDIAADRLESAFDLAVTRYPTAERDPEGGPAAPAARARDIHDAFAECEAVLAATGGDDQLRVLRHLDADHLREHRARFFGYSDNDNLRLFLWNAGLVSYGVQAHPDVTVDPDLHPYTARYLERALFEETLGEVAPASEWTDRWYDFETGDPREWFDAPERTWRDRGRAAGPVWGGSLAIVAWHLQTGRYLPDPDDLDGAVLALETSETLPRPEEVGYVLRSLGERGWLDRFDGLLVGRPQAYNPGSDRDPEFDDYRAAIREGATRELDRYAPETTAVFDVDFGHTSPTVPLPLGATATLDPADETLRFD